MSWWSKIFGTSDSGKDPTDDFFFTGITTNSGARVSHASALQSSVVYACVKMISGSIASLPFKVFRRLEDDKEEIPEHPLWEILHNQANEEHTAQEFVETMTANALMRGTAYAEIVPGRRGPIDQLVPIHPDEISLVEMFDRNGRARIVFEIKKNGEPIRRLLREELFIYRALVLNSNGIEGIDPIAAEANAIGARLASQDYAARFFQNDAQAGLIIKHPNHFIDKDARDRFIEGWDRKSLGTNRHKTRVLEWGLEPETITMTNEQSQFLETQKYQDFDICRMFGVPPHKVGILERATFTNIEQQAIEFVTDTLMPWAVRWTQCVKRDLIRQKSIFAQHNFNALLRGDTEQRFRAYAIGRNWGWLSANDVRELENMNGIGEDGDIYLQPLNMSLAGEPAEPSGMGGPPPRDDNETQALKPRPNGNGKADDHQQHG